MSDEKVIQLVSRRTQTPEDQYYDDLVTTVRGMSVEQIVSLLAAAHDAGVLSAVATELREFVKYLMAAD